MKLYLNADKTPHNRKAERSLHRASSVRIWLQAGYAKVGFALVLMVCIAVPVRASDGALPPEQAAFGIDSKGPEPDGQNYTITSSVDSPDERIFNHMPRITRSVTISGKNVVFERGTELYDNYNGVEDMEELHVYADTVIVRSPLHMPQTAVTIHARELRFEDASYDAPALIDTTPKSNPDRPEQFADGDAGLPAGNITLHLRTFYSDLGNDIRFILRGGDGQPAGYGRDGANGRSATDNCHGWMGNPHPGAIACTLLSGDCAWAMREWHLNNQPGPTDGEDAHPGGQPGDGGAGGILKANVNIDARHFDAAGGLAGEQAPVYHGGTGGEPRVWYGVQKCENNSPWFIDANGEHTTRDGRNSEPLQAAMPVGQAGAFELIGDAQSWLSPSGLRASLAYAGDAYLNNWIDMARDLLVAYAEALDTYQDSDAWYDLSDAWQLDLFQLQSEIRLYLHRMASQLDYFGNPAGWVPMLSFEVNREVFEDEIDHALQSMYMTYWLTNAERDVEDRLKGLSSGRDSLRDELVSFREQYDTAMRLIPDLQVRATNITLEIEELQVRIERTENELVARARSNVEERYKEEDWRKAAKITSVICKICPYGQPYVGGAGMGLDLVLDYTDESQDSGVDLASLPRKFKDANFEANADALRRELNQLTNLDLNNVEDCAAYAQSVGEVAKKLGPAFREIQDVLTDTGAPKSEVDAELQRIRAMDPALNELIDSVSALQVQKEAFSRLLATTMQEVGTLSTSIQQSVLTIDSLNREAAEQRGVLDHRAMSHLRVIERRAEARLQKYHYYFAKAYEYRTLRPYSGDLNLATIQNALRDLADAANGDYDLTADDFAAMRPLYTDQLRGIAYEIFEYYNSNRPELSAPARFRLTDEQLTALNEGEPVTINLMDMGRLRLSEENVRIVDLTVKDIEVQTDGGEDGAWGDVDIWLEHSGVSKIRHNGETYLFRHYNDDTENRIVWGARYDLGDERINSFRPSAASESLLRSLLSDRQSQDMMLYSRPGAWADITLTTSTNVQNGTGVRINRLEFEVLYDFSRGPANQATLKVETSGADLTPRVRLAKRDLNARQDGRGAFVRVFSKGEPVTIEAPVEYGRWSFRGWFDESGQALTSDPEDPVLQVTLNSDKVVRALYKDCVECPPFDIEEPIDDEVVPEVIDEQTDETTTPNRQDGPGAADDRAEPEVDSQSPVEIDAESESEAGQPVGPNFCGSGVLGMLPLTMLALLGLRLTDRNRMR